MIRLKKIKFDNPKNYVKKTLEVGDTILLGSSGMWKITSIKSGDFFMCGGMTTQFRMGDSYDRVFRIEFLDWIDSLTRMFSKGDTVTGVDEKGNHHVGVFKDNACQRICQGTLWIDTKEYTIPVDIFTAKKVSIKNFRSYHDY